MQGFSNNNSSDVIKLSPTMQQKKFEIICGRCLEDLMPRVLTCGHSYCTNCIRELMSMKGQCPKCSKTIPDQDVEKFPINFSLISVIEDRKSGGREALKRFHKNILSIQEQMQVMKTEAERILSLTSSKLSAIDGYLQNDDKDLNAKEIFKWITEVNREIKSFEAACSFSCKELRESATFNISQADHTPDIVDLYNEVKNTPEFYVFTKIKNKVTYARLTTNGSRLVLHAFDAHCVDDLKEIKMILLEDLKILLSKKKIVVNGFIEFECNERKVTRKILITPFATIYGNSFLKICTGENGSSLRGSPVSNNRLGNEHMKVMFTIGQGKFMQDDDCYFFNLDGTIKYKDYHGENVIGWCQAKEEGKNGLSVCHIYKKTTQPTTRQSLFNTVSNITLDHQIEEVNLRNHHSTLKNFVGTCVNEGEAPSLSDIQLPNEDLLVVNCGISFNVL